MAHSILFYLQILIKRISQVVLVYIIAVPTFKYWIMMATWAQMDRDSLIPWLGELILPFASMLILIFAFVLLEIFWELIEIESRIMKFNVKRNILNDYFYLFDETYYKGDLPQFQRRVDELLRFLNYLKEATDKDELMKLKEKALIFYANNGYIASKELREYFRQIGMTDDEVEAERQKYEIPRAHLIDFPERTEEWEEKERKEREDVQGS